ncbi:MAG: hypothetical protein HY674_19605 [Chloroflexi bacterium]|nr:hypothetical protein [Chloroflexota bacterium]
MDDIGILTTRSHPLLPFLLDQMAALTQVRPVLMFDRKDFTAKDRRIFQERTSGAFAVRDMSAIFHQYETVEVKDHNVADCLEYLHSRPLRLLLNGGTPRRLAWPLLQATPHGVINVHPGLLPKYRGATCCEWAVYYDEPVGVTAHFMDEGLDSGPIIFSRGLRVSKGEDYISVRVALYRLALECCAEAVRLVLERNLTAAQLPSQPSGQPFKPIPPELLAEVQRKLLAGTYGCAV